MRKLRLTFTLLLLERFIQHKDGAIDVAAAMDYADPELVSVEEVDVINLDVKPVRHLTDAEIAALGKEEQGEDVEKEWNRDYVNGALKERESRSW